MAYTKTQWVNDGEPSINATNLNKMEQGIADAQFPDGGLTGQMLVKTDTGYGWVDIPESAQWGNITGQLSEQTDLYSELNTLTTNVGTKITMPSGGTTGQVLTKTASGQEWASLNSKADTSTLATVESTSTASQAYAEGDYLVYNGQLYKLTAEIAVGDTLTVGTNIESTTVGSQLSELSTLHYRNYEALKTEYATVNSSVVDTAQGYTVEIWNRSTEAYVQVSFNLKTALSNGSTAVVLNFTSAITDLIHPTYRVYPGFIESGTYAGRSCVLHLDTWSDTKVLDMYNVLGGSIAAGTRLTFAFYVMQ